VFKRRKPDDPHTDLEGRPMPDASVASADPLRAERAGAPIRSADPGLGVPPFRPAPPKEAQAMSRAPFVPAPPPTPQPPIPSTAPRPVVSPAGRVGRDTAERRTLVVGRGISVQGTVQDAERLVVEGTVEATMIHATELSIAPGGVFKGEVEVEEAEIAGTIDGTLTARGSLQVRATGKVLGTARCRRLQVEDGGQITGRIEMLTESAASVRPAPAAAEARGEPAVTP
jgi:cytoskeletal protein CcmA (bactofilin family)